MKKTIMIALFITTLLISSCAESNQFTGQSVTIYKSPDCGCCAGHAAFLTGSKFNVQIIETADMKSIKRQHNIPSHMESCHTALIGDYFVEGHVPIEAINKLLTEKPDIDGIALPRMPAGSPGMPGVKQGPWTIYALKNGAATQYMTI